MGDKVPITVLRDGLLSGNEQHTMMLHSVTIARANSGGYDDKHNYFERQQI